MQALFFKQANAFRQQLAPSFQLNKLSQTVSIRRWMVGIIFLVALFAFEIFNFDTTRYALSNGLGMVGY